MSSNQKQSSAGGPQNQRFTPSPYQYIPHVGVGPEGFPVSNPPGTYVQPQQQPNQGGNQGPGLRGITPTGPPNQASTPPNAEIKVQTIQQPHMNHMFVQPQVRPTQGSYYPRTTGPASQAQRMANHNNRPQQPLFNSPAQYVNVPLAHMYITPNSIPPYPATNFATQRPPGFVQSLHQVYGPPISTFSPYATTPSQTPPVQYNNNYYLQTMVPRPSTIPQAVPVNPPTQNAINNAPLVNNPQHQTFSRPVNRRRAHAVSIIDPATGGDVLQDMFEDSSHPPSGESSARQTPQPPSHNHNKEVQATFAKQVMQAINNDEEPPHIEDSDINLDLDGNHLDQPLYVAPSPQVGQMPKYDHATIVQSSKLQAGAKEFVLSSNTAKETPIVSANCDAVEVTLPNKLPKDRESPVKGARKPREQQQLQPPAQREHRDSVKEQVSVRDSNSDKEASIIKEEVVEPLPESLPPANNVATYPTQAPVAVGKDSFKDNQVPEKRTQKKDAKVEPKAQSVERIDTVPAPVPVSVQQLPAVATQDINANAKSKQNAQRSAAKQPQVALQNNNQKQSVSVAAPIPIPQPTKSTGGKAHKKNEINQKGANKEGTDMDAFNDNAGGKEEDEEEVNFNVVTPSNPPVVSNNDIVNANVVLAVTETKNNVPQQMPHLDVNVNVDQPTSNNTKSESNEMTIKKPTAEILKTNKFSITDIVKEKPKNIKPYVSMVESQDEPDRVGAIPNDRLVQVKNDVNSKTSEINRFDNKLPYKEGQWSPANQNGVKVYQKDFLLALKDIPASKKLPDNIPDVVLADERGRLSDGRSSMGGRTDFAPSFNNYGSKSSSQRGAPPKRNSQSKMGPGGKLKPNVKVSISVREDVKLHETENAWRPARLNTGENATNDDKKTEELYKKVRGVLNKLTPQKFDTLLAQIKALQIDTSERLQGVIDLCFDKAVDEPNYSVAYALMCRELALMQVPTNTSTEEKPEYVNFRKLLITRCQSEFEKQSVDENTRSDKIKVIEESTDPEKKKDLQFELDEYDRRLRMKSVGNIRFIGELFKQKMLTVNIMMRCLNFLLDNKDEESLECLCKLLTTVGKELESNNVGLSSILTNEDAS
ncbi:hypothetical protein JTB14_037625 [Gonioctena quinquepunctata]|nr:hypothetical protein JTB14_037625 [Gonioctena quinquepunctata]